ncbi:Aspartate/glutamate/uridylate kinase [Panaeolus papilionaceus]|nr:Aspartate/glutamate/uridylate kinase [Panaeolus papilionaceus]
MTRPTTIPPCTIVLKLGTSSIVHEETHQPLLSTLSAIVETVVELKRQGHKVVLVSSGAIAVGLKRMDMESRPKHLSGKQALAAIGQGRLIALWDNLFGQLGQPIAQVLLTRGDISDRTRYINAVNTFKELLSMGVVPIVNENDTVSVSEIKFGDNDTLSAITSSMIQANYLFLLTDVDGLYTSNPRKDPHARQIQSVVSIAAIRSQVSTTTIGSALGTGGMETKLIAAEIATAAGVATVITSSKHPEHIFEIMEFDDAVVRGVTTGTGTSASASTDAWTSHTLNPSGSVIIDTGAHHVLSKRESGGRLLSAGVLGVLGAFASGQAVRVCVRRRVGREEKEDERRRYLEAMEGTRPGTPVMEALRVVEGVEGGVDSGSGVAAGEGVNADAEAETKPDDAEKDREMEDLARQEKAKEQDGGSEGFREGDIVEVGRGLANYNSAQIMAVKGMNSSMLPRVLGYADSEYVVENITIRVSLNAFSPSP